MALHRVFNSGADAVITGDDGSLWEAGEVRNLELPDYSWVDRKIAAGELVDLGETVDPPPAAPAPLAPVPPETMESEGTL